MNCGVKTSSTTPSLAGCLTGGHPLPARPNPLLPLPGKQRAFSAHAGSLYYSLSTRSRMPTGFAKDKAARPDACTVWPDPEPGAPMADMKFDHGSTRAILSGAFSPLVDGAGAASPLEASGVAAPAFLPSMGRAMERCCIRASSTCFRAFSSSISPSISFAQIPASVAACSNRLYRNVFLLGGVCRSVSRFQLPREYHKGCKPLHIFNHIRCPWVTKVSAAKQTSPFLRLKPNSFVTLRGLTERSATEFSGRNHALIQSPNSKPFARSPFPRSLSSP